MYLVLSNEVVGFLHLILNLELLAQPLPLESSEAQEPTHTHTHRDMLRVTALLHQVLFIIS